MSVPRLFLSLLTAAATGAAIGLAAPLLAILSLS